MGSSPRLAFAAALACLGAAASLACALAADGAGDPAEPGALRVAAVGPALLLPGSRLWVGVDGLPCSVDSAVLLVQGTIHLAGAPAREVRSELAATISSRGGLEAPVPADWLASLANDIGTLRAEVRAIVVAGADRTPVRSAPRTVYLELARSISPLVSAVAPALVRPGHPLDVHGARFLLPPGEGRTSLDVEGELQPAAGGAPVPLHGELDLAPSDPLDRTRGSAIADPLTFGLVPGVAEVAVTPVNRMADGTVVRGSPFRARLECAATTVAGVSAETLRLGRYIQFTGGGFIAGPAALTLLRLSGRFEPDGGTPREVDVEIVPEVLSGERARYVVEEFDGPGRAIDFRGETGWWSATISPITWVAGRRTVGEASTARLRIGAPRQVVHLRFLPAYREALERFGLGAMDRAVRDRVLAVVRRDYARAGLEFRETAPEDYALYSEVDIDGPDPNGLGVFGNDATPGKDVGNARLHDRIGGWNAETSADGIPAWGGIFVESFLGLSPHAAVPSPLASAVFDAIFDGLRPERGGRPADEDDAARPLAPVSPGGVGCPSAGRARQVACAVWALGGLIGSTVSHEVGHSLGLADPFGPADAVHRPGDEPGMLMEAGAARPFEERAEVAGHEAGRFAEDELAYLAAILPLDEEDE